MKHDCNVSVIFRLDIIPRKKSPRLLFLSFVHLFVYGKSAGLIQLYGKNQPSNTKLHNPEELTRGKSLTQLASELGIAMATATAEVYVA